MYNFSFKNPQKGVKIMFIIVKFLKKRKIKKAVKKWKVDTTDDMLIHNMATGLVDKLENSGLKGDEIEEAVHNNTKFITTAVEEGVELMSLCDQVKDTVLAKDTALEKMEAVVIKSQGAEAKERGEGIVTSTVKKVGVKVKGMFNRKSEKDTTDKDTSKKKANQTTEAPAIAGATA